MSSIYIKDDSPFYQVRYYDKLEADPKKRRKTFSSKVKVSPSDRKRYSLGRRPQGNADIKKLKKQFEDALLERNLYSRAKVKLRRSPLLSDAFLEFLEKKPNLTKHTISAYELAYNHFVAACHDKDLAGYNYRDYTRFLEYLTGKGYSDTTKAIHMRHLSAIWKYFVAQNYVHENIIIKLRPPRIEPDPIPFDEMQVILDYFEKRDFWQYAFVYYMLLTGMRESSALTQKFKDINFSGRVIKAVNVKAQRREFYVPVSEELSELLTEIGKRRNKKEDRLFYMYAESGDGLKFWHRAMKKLNEKDEETGKTPLKQKYMMKQLRKTYASWLADAGVDIGVVKNLLDHSNIAVTENHYLKSNAQRYLGDVNKTRFRSVKKAV